MKGGRAIIGYIVGYVAANAMIMIGNSFTLNLINISIATLLGVFVVNFLMMYLEKAKKFFMDSIPGIIVGIAMTFAGAWISIPANDLKLLAIIIVYGILGLLCGLGTNFFVKEITDRIK